MAFDRTTKDEQTFTALTDTPTAITASNYVRGNTGGSDLEFRTAAQTLGDIGAAALGVKQDWTAAQKPATQTATITATSVTLDFDAYQNFVLTMTPSSGTSMTFTNPTTDAGNVGQTGVIVLIQHSSAITGLWGTQYKLPLGAAPDLSSGSSKVDILPYCIQADDNILIGAPQLDLTS